MKSNFALQTFTLLIAWLVFENFNLSTGVHSIPEKSLPNGRKNSEAHANCLHTLDFSWHQSGARVSHYLQPPYKIKTIVLDAGHGGKDPGCIGASAQEKENTLAIVLRLGAYIEENYPEIKVIYTRDSDVFIELNERAAIANRNNADLFISIHCNAMPGKTVQGAETYVLGLHRSKDNLDVAKRENASIYLEENYQKNYAGYDPDSPEAEIFASLWQSAYLEQSILFAGYVQQFAAAVVFREDRGVKQAGFLVLRETAMPSVLIETGYLTNATEDAFLASEEGREQMALSIFQAFEAYKRHMELGKPLDQVAEAPAPKKTPAAKTSAATQSAPPKTQNPVTAKAKPTAQTDNKPIEAKAKPAVNTVSAIKPAPTFTILLLAWPNKLDPNVGKLSLMANVRERFLEGKYHYYSGNYPTRADAEKVLPEIQNMGFKTATIVQL
ncbi:MAG TPA: N-acetylmuramoyl-L-alanine amidase [Saprospirales bacterium]|nr:N-acetylmuramoyl-L-alanine amidase [Saprospirales bacterium]